MKTWILKLSQERTRECTKFQDTFSKFGCPGWVVFCEDLFGARRFGSLSLFKPRFLPFGFSWVLMWYLRWLEVLNAFSQRWHGKRLLFSWISEMCLLRLQAVTKISPQMEHCSFSRVGLCFFEMWPHSPLFCLAAKEHTLHLYFRSSEWVSTWVSKEAFVFVLCPQWGQRKGLSNFVCWERMCARSELLMSDSLQSWQLTVSFNFVKPRVFLCTSCRNSPLCTFPSYTSGW